MVKDTIALGTLFIVVVCVVVVFLKYPRHDLPPLQEPQSSTSVKGVVEAVGNPDKTITIFTSKSVHVTVSLTDKTSIRNTNGTVVDYSTIQPGMEVTSIGLAENSYSLTATSILISPQGVDTRPVQPDNVFEQSIIPDTYSITGMAEGSWYFEGSFPVIVRDAHGTLIDRAHAYAQNEWRVEGLVPFNAWLSFDDPLTATGTIEFQKNNPSGLPENVEKVIIPVKFATQAGTTPVKLYYPNSRKASEIGDACDAQTLLPVRRNIPNTESPIRDTISLLIKGALTHDETVQGFTTDFPDENFKLLSSDLATDGTLTLTFTQVPGFTSGGSCKMGLLREEIRKTALQFSSVRKVMFKPDELFQP